MTMRLSEAIRLGAMMAPQSFSGLETTRRYGFLWRKVQRTTCALGAAFEAANVPTIRKTFPAREVRPFRGKPYITTTTDEVQVPDEWLVVMYRVVTCPECVKSSDIVDRMIPHLNDDHRWTRERIAAWVATVEPQDAALPVREPTAFDAVPTKSPDAVTHG